MELKISKIAFINEMKAYAFDMVADPSVCNDKTAVLKAFIGVMDFVLYREEKKAIKGGTDKGLNCNTEDHLKKFVADLKEIGIEADVHVVDVSNKRD